MNKQIRTFIIIVIAVVSLIAVFVVGSDDSEVITVSADNGSAKVEFSKEALPDGVSPSDISITKITLEEAPFELEGIEPAIYSLEPHGLTFEKPVMFKTEMETVDGEVPFLYHVFGDEIETIDEVQYTIGEDGVATISAPLNHFSHVFYREIQNGAVISGPSVTVPEVENTVLGQQPHGVAVFRQPDRPTEGGRFSNTVLGFITAAGKTLIRYEPGGFISGSIQGGTELEPRLVQDRPPRTEYHTQFTIETDDFTCREVGQTNMTYNIRATWTEVKENVDDITGEVVFSSERFVVGRYEAFSPPFRCNPAPIDFDRDRGAINSEGRRPVEEKGFEDSEPMTRVLMLVLNGSFYPASQFIIEGVEGPSASGCSQPHYRERGTDFNVYGLRDLDSAEIISQPALGLSGCGFGLYDTIERRVVTLTGEQSAALLGHIVFGLD